MFDPYHKWLGILPKDQPPHHYRLLGLEACESDLDVIEGAADRAMGYIRQYQSGEHSALAAKLLNEIATARLCLLKPASKADYDVKLKQKLAPAQPTPAASEADSFDLDSALSDLEAAPKRKSSSRRQKKSEGSQRMLVGGGAAVVAGIVLLVVLSSMKSRPPAEQLPKLPSNTATTSPNSTTIAKPDQIKPTTPDKGGTRKPGPNEQALRVEPLGEAVNLLADVDLTRDTGLGKWQQTEQTFVGDPHSRLFLPAKLPDDYQLQVTARQMEGSNTLGIGFMMSGRQGVFAVDGYGIPVSGLYIDGLEPNANCTTRRGKLFQGKQAGKIVLTIHPGHFHASFDGKTIADWYGDPERLFLHTHWGIACRECPFIGIASERYAIESATLQPIKPEPVAPPIARLDRDIELLPLIDIARDTRGGKWQLIDSVLSSSDGFAKIEVPMDVPQAYTLSATVEVPAQTRVNTEANFGLISEGSFFGLIASPTIGGLDTIDGLRFHENETRFEGSILKPGVPVRIDCTVTKSGIRMEAGGKTVVDWHGDIRRLRINGEWSATNGRRLFLGSLNSVKFSDIKLGPPHPAPKMPSHPPFATGKPVDLLAFIDPSRDALTGTWKKEGTLLRVMGDVTLSKLAIPCEVPSDYKLTIRMARESGAKAENEALVIDLPTRSSTAQLVLDTHGSTLSGVQADGGLIQFNKTSVPGPVIPPGTARDFVIYIRQTGLKVLRGDEVLMDWEGNPNRFAQQGMWAVPGRQIAFGSWEQRFRFEKIELEPLEPATFSMPSELPSDGNLLSIIDPKRDARKGEWKLTGDGLVVPAIQPSRLLVPCPVPERYELNLTVERKSGTNELFIGLVVGGRPCCAGIDGGPSNLAGLMHLDHTTFHLPINPTCRNYTGPLFPMGRAVKVRCIVLPDTIIVTCGSKEVLRWHGDARRFALSNDYLPSNVTQSDRDHLWLGSWSSEYVIHDLNLKPLSEEDAEHIAGEFSGVFPITSQFNVPLADVSPGDGTAPAASTGLEILSAEYGASDQYVDLTESLAAAAKKGMLLLCVDDSLVPESKAEAADQNKGIAVYNAKSLHLKYRLNGVEKKETFEHGHVVKLDSRPASTTKVPKGFRLMEARLGSGVFDESTWVDVARQLRPFVKKDALSMTEDDVAKSFAGKLADPKSDVLKSIFVRYQYEGQERITIISSGSPIFLGDVPLVPGLIMLAFEGANFEKQVLAAIDPQVNVNYGYGSAGRDVPTDKFTVRWLGTLNVTKAESYSFYVKADDGARIWIDGELVIDAWTSEKGSADLKLTKKQHTIRVDFVDRQVVAGIFLEWKSDSIERQIIPPSVFFHDPKVAKQLGVK